VKRLAAVDRTGPPRRVVCDVRWGSQSLDPSHPSNPSRNFLKSTTKWFVPEVLVGLGYTSLSLRRAWSERWRTVPTTPFRKASGDVPPNASLFVVPPSGGLSLFDSRSKNRLKAGLRTFCGRCGRRLRAAKRCGPGCCPFATPSALSRHAAECTAVRIVRFGTP